MGEYQVWADAFPDESAVAAVITKVDPEIVDEHGWSAVGSRTCAPGRFRETFAEEVGDLFRCFVNLDEAVPVVVHLNWLAADPHP